jgi:hypothetical protein
MLQSFYSVLAATVNDGSESRPNKSADPTIGHAVRLRANFQPRFLIGEYHEGNIYRVAQCAQGA